MDDKQMTRSIFAQRFYDLRRELDMNQSAFAEYLGLSRAAVSFYENADKEGGRLPDMVTLRRLCAKLRVPADYLLGLSSERVYGKYLNRGIIIDTLVAIGFSKEIAEKIYSSEFLTIDPRDREGIIFAIDFLLGTDSGGPFLTTWHHYVTKYKEELLLSEVSEPISPDEMGFYQERLGGSGMFIVNKQEYLDAIFSIRFDKEIVPLLKSVTEELFSKARDNHERMKAVVRKQLGLDDSTTES